MFCSVLFNNKGIGGGSFAPVLLLIPCFCASHCFRGGLCLVFVLLCITKYPFEFFSHLGEAVCFAFIVLLMSCDSECFCSVAHLRGVIGWSAICDCGIS